MSIFSMNRQIRNQIYKFKMTFHFVHFLPASNCDATPFLKLISCDLSLNTRCALFYILGGGLILCYLSHVDYMPCAHLWALYDDGCVGLDHSRACGCEVWF